MSLRNVCNRGVLPNRPFASAVSRPMATHARISRKVVVGALPSRSATSAAVSLASSQVIGERQVGHGAHRLADPMAGHHRGHLIVDAAGRRRNSTVARVMTQVLQLRTELFRSIEMTNVSVIGT